MWIRIAAAVAGGALFIATGVVTGQLAPAAFPPASETSIYLGIWANPALSPTRDQEEAVTLREGSGTNGINRRFALHLHYYAWPDLAQELNAAGVFQPNPELSGDISRGRVPVISWKCDGSVADSDAVIASGDPKEDAVILATARALAQYPGPVLLRWFWEFNLAANNQPCRGDSGGAFTAQAYNDFIGAWQRMRRLFRQAGATNVLFLWNPGHYRADGAADDPHGFYPGNDFVDWIGIDTYQRSPNETFDDDFALFYNDFSQSKYGNRPLIVGENGSAPFAQYNMELQHPYLLGLLSGVQANRYPLLRAYCYFDSGGQDSWVLDDNDGRGNGGLAALSILGASPAFITRPLRIPRQINFR